MQQSLDHLGQMDEFTQMNEQFSKIMEKQELRKDERNIIANARAKKIQMQYAMMSKQYGREFTPKRNLRDGNPKLAAIEDEIAKELAAAETRVGKVHTREEE